MTNPYARTYKTQQVQTASPEELLILLYDGAIRFLNVAKVSHSEGNVEKFNNNVIKAQRILLEFMTTLDVDKGGNMAKNLYALYEYLHYRLIEANTKKDVTMLEEVLTHLRELKETWEQAIGIAKQEQLEESNCSSNDHVYTA